MTTNSSLPKKRFLLDAFSFKEIALIMIICLSTSVLWVSPVGRYTDIFLLRTLFYLRGETPVPNNIILVALDDLTVAALDEKGDLVNRRYLAEVLNKIHDSSPDVVIFDVGFKKSANDVEGDLLLAEAMTRGPTVIVKADADIRFLSEVELQKRAEIKMGNDPRFEEAATLVVSPLINTLNKIAFEIYLPKGVDEHRVPLKAALEVGGIKNIGTPSRGDLINFYGQPNAIPYISMYQILSGQFDFKNKIVFIGFKSQNTYGNVPGYYDIFSTSGSFLRQYFGVEVHATIAANLIDHSFIRRLSLNVEAGLMGLFSIISMMILLRNKPSIGLRYYCAIIGLLCLLTVWMFLSFQILFPGTSLILPITPLLLAATWYCCANQLSLENEVLKMQLDDKSQADV